MAETSNPFQAWYDYSDMTQNVLPAIFYSTEERLSKLTEAERTRLKKEYEMGI
jgi:hypothetical protein